MRNQFTLLLASSCLLMTTLMGACGSSGQSSDATSSDTLSQQTPTMQLELAWKTDTVLTGSESALFDTARNRIYVTCGNSAPSAKDGDGFIALLNPNGDIEDLQWVTGMDAPKGMAQINDMLYVSDVDQIRVINLETARIERTIPVPGAEFLNDVCTDGTQIFISDSRTHKVYAMQADGQAEVILENSPGVNGLESAYGKLYTLDLRGMNTYNIPEFSNLMSDTTVKGGDGLVVLNDSTFVISVWAGEIYGVSGQERFPLLDTKADESNTADIGWVPGSNLILVPTFMKNELAAYTLSW